ncbi:UNVERIFIED_CONTAM: hypothetical protein PYX00_006964 [Menopon gallinae]|uniref:tRNA-dihydrouridine(47) synthase [NAD(P)(+)] n=1 Tax=Menopon gallinae TaxID=328185 RepID=A0AAW2HHV6_9NEOP
MSLKEIKKNDASKGIAHIKGEYVVKVEPDEIPAKKAKLNDEPKKKKGQFKNRHGTNKTPTDLNSCLCSSLIDVPEDLPTLPKCEYNNCKYLHNLNKYLETKPPDIGDKCFTYETKGYCPRGVTCRFGKSHLTDTGRNKKCPQKMAEYEKNGLKCVNSVSKDIQFKLKKKTYDFSKSNAIVEEINKSKNEDTNCVNEDSEKNIGPCSDADEIKLKQNEKKKINWEGKLYLSPLTTLGNLPFRRICKEFGADITCAEMTMAPSLLQSFQYEWALIKRHQSEDLFGIQICGNNHSVMTKCAQLLEETVEVDFIDINLGCPIDMVYQKGSGSGLLRREKALNIIIQSMTRVLSLPLTVKTRTGVYADKNVAHKLIPIYKSAGVSLITVHGRSREQRYTKTADWEYINECAKIANPIPLFGNGDILSYTDYYDRMTNFNDISGVMIGRGALYKPWIFTEIKEQKDWDISSSERFEIIRKYVNYGLEHWGSDTKGVELTRQFTLEWLSFLYRYIPVGLLERPPQKINERPPRYVGRNDLETLMASSNCSDWVKITEMLLGPVPDNFHFLPKHKANAWAT